MFVETEFLWVVKLFLILQILVSGALISDATLKL